jgi:hypothetical protein
MSVFAAGVHRRGVIAPKVIDGDKSTRSPTQLSVPTLNALDIAISERLLRKIGVVTETGHRDRA